MFNKEDLPVYVNLVAKFEDREVLLSSQHISDFIHNAIDVFTDAMITKDIIKKLVDNSNE